MLRYLFLGNCISLIWMQMPFISRQRLRELANKGLPGVKMLYRNNEDAEFTATDARENKKIYNPGSSAYLLSTFSRAKKKSKDMAKGALLSENITLEIAKEYRLSSDQIYNLLPDIDVRGTALHEICQTSLERRNPVLHHHINLPPCVFSPYRSLNGTCNNIIFLQWGSAPRKFNRFLKPDYRDDISLPRADTNGQPLPSARLVSSSIITDLDLPDRRWTLMLMQWGQFLDHDLTHTAGALDDNGEVPECCNIPENQQNFFCYPIQIPKDDYFYSQYNQTCLEFLRNLPAPRPGCALGPREQINQLTAYLDGSVIYGSDDDLGQQLRTYENGHLKTTPFPPYKDLLPKDSRNEGDCVPPMSDDERCFIGGDIRVNEQSSLTTMHTIWLREHNRIVDGLREINPSWNDETLYQEGRKIVGAIIQFITFNEFLPIILGKEIHNYDLQLVQTGYYRGYNAYVDASINNVFAAAAFRFGHTLLQSKFDLYNSENELMPLDDAVLSKMFFKPFQMYTEGRVDQHIRGLIRKNIQSFDNHITEEVTNHLFQESDKPFGMDLISLNIQRGRDHGIPGYTKWREFCGLGKPRNFEELAPLIPLDRAYKFKEVYKHVNDIDLFPAGVSELPVEDGVLGPTFACIIAKQFTLCRQGDRFWFENQLPNVSGIKTAFTLDQLNEIRKSSLAKVVCENSDDVPSIQRHIMMPSSRSNPVIPCKDLPSIDFTKWKSIFMPFEKDHQFAPLKLKATIEIISKTNQN